MKIINKIKSKLFSKKSGSGIKVSLAQFEKMDILDHIEKIVDIAKKQGMDKCLITAKKHINYVTEKLNINPLQAMLFSLLMEQAASNRILLSEIAESVKSNKVRIIKYMTECEDLEKKKLVRCSRGDCISYRIPRAVRESLRKNNDFIPEKSENLTISKFFTSIENIFTEKENDELTYEAMSNELIDLVDQNMHLEFCKKIKSYNLSEDNFILLICFCHLAGNNNDDNIGIHDINFIWDDKSEMREQKLALQQGYHMLLDSKLIEYNHNGGFLNTESWKVSDMAKKDLLSELSLKENQSYKKDLILHENIKEKKMYYNSRERKEIETLSSLLSDENYKKIQKRLDGKGMRKGFACLFSGAPGTGKTETAMQIARLTKRNIMMVDISGIKSMWVGESEKNVKKIFETYKSAVENSAITPILLFNEADAIIGKRKEFVSSSRAVDQMENTIQNIILQEMENLCGILIATTNLTQNMDSAFERRFLYKITFDRPEPESRKGIWNSLMPDISDERINDLSHKFDLSGGQIENIARKLEVDQIIQGDCAMDSLLKYCTDEVNNCFNESKSKEIGFTANY